MADVLLDGGGPFDDYSSNDVGYQPAVRTVAEVLTSVRRTFGDDDGVQILDSDVIRWINDAQDTVVNRARPLKARAFIDSITGVSEYKLPSQNIIQIESLHYDGRLLPNVTIAQAERDFADGAPLGEPSCWWEWSGNFTFYPAPAESKQIAIYYTMAAARVSTVNDVLGVPDKFFQTIVAYCLQQAYELDERMDFASQKAAQVSQNLDDFVDEERTAQHMTYETITRIDLGY